MLPIRKLYRGRPLLLLLTLLTVFSLIGIACELSIPSGASDLVQPDAAQSQLFKGITYERRVTTDPRPMVIHIVTVDLKNANVTPFVTPPDNPDADRSVNAQTVPAFLEKYDLQLAINANAFKPWHDYGPLGYAPQAGEAVDPIGFAASKGTPYSEDEPGQPVLYIYPTNKASIDTKVGRVQWAVAGNKLLVNNNTAEPDLGTTPEPRTAIGLNQAGTKMFIVVVDGRQPGYSEGISWTELAQLFLDLNAYDAISLDGGGSSTLVIDDGSGSPQVLNSPVHQGIPGNLRPTAVQLGFYADK